MTPATLVSTPEATQLSHLLESFRVDAARKISRQHKGLHGQYFTPLPIAQFMASLADVREPLVRILDAGAGIGTLFGHAVAALCAKEKRPEQILVTAYEMDLSLSDYLAEAMRACQITCERHGIEFEGRIIAEDFLECAAEHLETNLFASAAQESYNYAILNPPYFKINVDSRERALLRKIGLETSNIYAGFLAAAIGLLEPGGELVAITPRSFCNGPYFLPFRQAFLATMRLRRLHLFKSREAAFADDAVLQENLIFHAIRTAQEFPSITITSSAEPADDMLSWRVAHYDEVLKPKDSERVVHIATDDIESLVSQKCEAFVASLGQLGLSVSTGRVVDFRARQYLHGKPRRGTVPLITPRNLRKGLIEWPVEQTRKPSAIEAHKQTESLLVRNECYVLVKRFSAKEERRRVVAAIVDPECIDAEYLGIENHLNYFHDNGHGCDPILARGLAAFLNSTLFDCYFRQFSGHTQVNASDLRRMRYPEAEVLRRIGGANPGDFENQAAIDQLIDRELLQDWRSAKLSPINAMTKIDDAIAVLEAVGLPKAQQGERSALTLLALLDLKPRTPWSKAVAPLRGITQMMDFFAEHYGKRYAPNTRETVRRQTVHQFVAAGIAVQNPDNPARPTNSGKNVYQIEPATLKLVQKYGSASWTRQLRQYLTSIETLSKRYAQQREMSLIPVSVAQGKKIRLSPGGQNVLVKQILEEFCPRFTPAAKVLYVGDTGEKFAFLEPDGLISLGVAFDSHGKMPDIIVHHTKCNWLVLIEAVTSHGPVDPKRHTELKNMFQGSSAGLVFLTAFPDRRTMAKYLNNISWETEVWVADAPDHLVHFNGDRFLGPHK